MRYRTAYGILRGFFGAVIDTCEEAFTVDQLIETRIILGALDIATRENEEKDKVSVQNSAITTKKSV